MSRRAGFLTVQASLPYTQNQACEAGIPSPEAWKGLGSEVSLSRTLGHPTPPLHRIPELVGGLEPRTC